MKILLVVIFINICSIALSEDNINCVPLAGMNNLKQEIFSDVVELYEYVGKHPKIPEAFCNIKLSTAEIEKRIINRAQKDSRVKSNKKLHGIHFENEYSSLLKLFGKLTTNKKNITENHTFKSNCKEVLCAVKEIFGQDVGPKILYILQEFGLNGSFLSFNEAENWSNEELDVLLQGLEDLPKGMLSFDDNKSFVRHVRGQNYAKSPPGKGCVQAIDDLRFFDCWWKNLNKADRMTTPTHEIGHYVGLELGLDEHSAWLELSGWEIEQYYDENKKLKTKWNMNKDACFLSTYGQKDPREDFAEMFVAYRYLPEIFQKTCPEKYRYFKDFIYNKIEFTKDKKFCEKQPRLKYKKGLWGLFR